MLNIVNSCIGTKYTSRFGPLMAQLALEAVQACFFVFVLSEISFRN